MKRIAALGLLCAVMAPMVAVGSAAEAAQRAHWRECPTSGTMDEGQLQAVRISCGHAKQLVLSFMTKAEHEGRPRLRTFGFWCKNIPTQSGIICRRGEKIARFVGSPSFD